MRLLHRLSLEIAALHHRKTLFPFDKRQRATGSRSAPIFCGCHCPARDADANGAIRCASTGTRWVPWILLGARRWHWVVLVSLTARRHRFGDRRVVAPGTAPRRPFRRRMTPRGLALCAWPVVASPGWRPGFFYGLQIEPTADRGMIDQPAAAFRACRPCRDTTRLFLATLAGPCRPSSTTSPRGCTPCRAEHHVIAGACASTNACRSTARLQDSRMRHCLDRRPANRYTRIGADTGGSASLGSRRVPETFHLDRRRPHPLQAFRPLTHTLSTARSCLSRAARKMIERGLSCEEPAATRIPAKTGLFGDCLRFASNDSLGLLSHVASPCSRGSAPAGVRPRRMLANPG